MNKIRLGFEIGSGDPVDIPVNHMVITGQTQMAGKTTATEALIARSGVKALAFITKRGEGSFQGAALVDPYFKEEAGWKFVSSVLEASRSEKLKFERAWIIRASKGARTLKEVQANIKGLMETARGISADVYLTLDAYLDEVVPQIDQIRWAKSITLEPGLNVMDLTRVNPEMQHLVIKSSLDWVLNHETDTVVIIPEAWKFIPEGRGTPVKLSAEAYIRQSAGLQNFLWLDSQDIAGIEKIILKSVPLWILGVQREENEVRRTLAEIPAGIKRPGPADIALLGLGQFYACWGKHVRHTYVQPVWMSEAEAMSIAQGNLEVESVLERSRLPQTATFWEPEKVPLLDQPLARPILAETLPGEEADDMTNSEEILNVLYEIRSLLRSPRVAPEPEAAAASHNGDGAAQGQMLDEDAFYQRFKQRLLREPALIKLATTVPEIEIETVRPVIQMSDGDLRGWLVKLISEGFFDDPGSTGTAAFTELVRRGKRIDKPNVYRSLNSLAELGVVTRELQGKEKLYVKNPDLKITRKEK